MPVARQQGGVGHVRRPRRWVLRGASDGAHGVVREAEKGPGERRSEGIREKVRMWGMRGCVAATLLWGCVLVLGSLRIRARAAGPLEEEVSSRNLAMLALTHSAIPQGPKAPFKAGLLRCGAPGPPPACPSLAPCAGPSEGGHLGLRWCVRRLVGKETEAAEAEESEGAKGVALAAGVAAAQGIEWDPEWKGVRDEGREGGNEGAEWEDKAGVGAWQGQVLVLRNVFVTHRGVVFNRTHVFLPGGAGSTAALPFQYPKGTQVTEHHTVINAALGDTARHLLDEVALRLPLFLLLSPFLPRLSHHSTRFVLGPVKHHDMLLVLSQHILGADPLASALSMGSNKLVFAHTLIQPIHDLSWHPSAALWSHLRRHFLLPPSALPMFTPTWAPAAPPSAAGLPVPSSDWLVALALPPLAVRVTLEHADANYGNYGNDFGDSLETAVMDHFWFHRVQTLDGISDFASAVALFRRTVLLVSSPGRASAFIPFMPQQAIVVGLEPDNLAALQTSMPQHKGLGHLAEGLILVRQLARACGLRYVRVACQLVMHTQDVSAASLEMSLVCARAEVQRVLDWVEPHILMNPGLNPTASDLAAAALSRSIPGTALSSAAQVQRFRSWASCVAQRGKWVKDDTPRRLPWPRWGWVFCEERWKQAHPGGLDRSTADGVAEQYAAGIGTVGAWKVREGLKYVWKVPEKECGRAEQGAAGKAAAQPWVEFDAVRFCRFVGPGFRLLLLGDSIQNQFMESLIFNILAPSKERRRELLVEESIAEECRQWLTSQGGQAPSHEYCRTYAFKVDYCPGFVIDFMRNDLLSIVLDAPPAHDHMPWAQLLRGHADLAHVILYNRGPHWIPSSAFLHEVLSASNLLRHAFPSKLLIYRNTPPGHQGCPEAHLPLSVRPSGEGLPYHWGEFEAQNRRARAVVEALGVVFMDVDSMTALRPDGHLGLIWNGSVLDCLHYCHPGPIDSWVQLLFNILLQLRFRQSPS